MRTLLIVDDEYWIRYKLANRFDWAQFEIGKILEAANGEEALKQIESEPVDVVITDMDMPYMDGGTFMQALRERHKDIPVVVLSGYSDFHIVREAILGGAMDYILKPVKPEELYEALRRVLNHAPAHSAKPAEPFGSVNQSTLVQIQEYIRGHFEEELSLPRLSELFNVSQSHISRSFKKEFGVNLTVFINSCRLNAAREMLDKGEKNITETAALVGYSDYAYFSSLFKKQFGLSPREYLKEHSD